MAEELEAENASWERTAKDLAAGAAGGIAQVLLGECPELSSACLCAGVFAIGKLLLLFIRRNQVKCVGCNRGSFFFLSDFLFRQFL